MKEILIYTVPSIISSFVGYIIGYRKNVVDLQSVRLDNLEKSIKVYNVIIDDMANKIEELTAEIHRLEERIEKLMEENKQLKKEAKSK